MGKAKKKPVTPNDHIEELRDVLRDEARGSQPQSPRVAKAHYVDFIETEVNDLRRQELQLECDLARVRGFLHAATLKLRNELGQV